MSGLSLLLGIATFLAAAVLPGGVTLRVVAPVAALVAATFLRALAPLFPPAALLATGFRAAVVGLYLAGVCGDLLRADREPSRTLRLASLGAAGLLLLVVLHNLLGSTPPSLSHDRLLMNVVNPWGMAVVALGVLYWVRTAGLLAERGSMPNGVAVTVIVASFLLAAMETLIVAGVIPGNTGKVALDLGGRGLANMSTNETGSFALGLLICNLRLASDRRGGGAILAGIANLSTILVTESRTALVGVAAVLLLHVLWGGARWRRLALSALPLVVAFGFAAYHVARARTLENLQGHGGGMAQMLTRAGSGRILVWLSFLDVFAQSANRQPSRWMVGTGPKSLEPLYNQTPLEALGLAAEQAPFLPLHSDVVNVFITTGALGLVCWLAMVLGLLRIPFDDRYRATAYGAVFAFTFISAIDMLIYLPVGVALLMAAVASSTRGDVWSARPSERP